MVQLNIKIPEHIRKHYHISPEFAARARRAIRATLERLYELEFYDGDTALARMDQRIDELDRQSRELERSYEAARDELETMKKAREEREAHLKAQKKREQTAEQRARILETLVSDKRFHEYARNVRNNNLHIANPDSVCKAIKTQFSVELSEDDMLTAIGKATGESA